MDFSRTARWLWCAAIAGPVAIYFLLTLPLWSGRSSPALREIAMLSLMTGSTLLVPVLAAVPGAVFFLISGVLRSRDRHQRIHTLSCFLACLALFGLCLAAFKMTRDGRSAAMKRAAENGDQIIAALEDFRQDHGQYPHALSELVPQYLPGLPETGMIGYPDFYYHPGGGPNPWIADASVGYELGIHCSSGMLNWDRFFYWPSEKYPDFVYGGGVERIGRWAYVHE